VPADPSVQQKNTSDKTSKGYPYLGGVLGEVAAAVAKTRTFLSERYRQIFMRRGKCTALAAIARFIPVASWYLPASFEVGFHHHRPHRHHWAAGAAHARLPEILFPGQIEARL
jgi:hypothetical protein